MSNSWICCQIGAREHYAIPRVLHTNGRLQALYSDLWVGPGLQKLAGAIGSKIARSISGRFHQELAQAQVISWPLRAMAWESKVRRSGKSANALDKYSAFSEVGSRFALSVRNSLDKLRDIDERTIVFAYDTGALEILEWCKAKGIPSVVGQMDPNRTEMQMVLEEEARWPGWSARNSILPEDYIKRRESEWALADRVMVNSEFCKKSLIEQGVSAKKLAVVPLCYEIDSRKAHDAMMTLESEAKAKLRSRSFSKACPMRVLWLGQVILRKGIQYLIQSARELQSEPIVFDIVGPIGISDEAIASAPPNTFFHGRATRDQISKWYGQADVFVLPILSDGFAITQLEAMAHGLPVVATPCCGDVVSDGMDGFIVPARDPQSLARTLLRYLLDPGLLNKHKSAALLKSSQFGKDRLVKNLLNLEKLLFAVG